MDGKIGNYLSTIRSKYCIFYPHPGPYHLHMRRSRSVHHMNTERCLSPDNTIFFTTSPWRKARWLITESGLFEFTSHALNGSKRLFSETKHYPIFFTYKSRLIGEGGFSLRVAYQLTYVFQLHVRSFGFLPETCST